MAEREYRIIVPRTDNQGNLIKTEVFRDVALAITDRFDGVTIYPRIGGCYRMEETGAVVCDLSVEFQVVATGKTEGDLEAGQRFMYDLAEQLGDTLGQEGMFEQQDFETRTNFVPTRLAPQAVAAVRTGRAVERTPDAIVKRLLGSA